MSSSSSRIYAYVYDSRNGEWSRYKGFNRTLGGSEHHQKGVFLNGSLYFVTGYPGKWETLEVEMPEELTFVQLAAGISGNGEAGEKKLFMFGGIGDGVSISMMVWELDVKERKWKEIRSVPEVICRKLGSVCDHQPDEHIYCFWHQGMICVCCYTWPQVWCFKVATRTWHVVPKAPSLPEKWIHGFQWFPFAPELYALV